MSTWRVLAWATEAYLFLAVATITPQRMKRAHRRLDYWMARLMRNDPLKETR